MQVTTGMESNTTSPPLADGFLVQDDPRGRLLLAMAQSIVDKGYSRTVVADVVRIARVSRRTFYENFADREDCFLALCEAFTAQARAVIADAADPALPWQDQARTAIAAHSRLLTAEPALTRSFFFEIYSIGERGMRTHRRVHRLFAEQLCELAERVRRDDPSLNAVSFTTASAIVAAIGELAMLAIEHAGDDEYEAETERAAFDLIAAVLTAKPV